MNRSFRPDEPPERVALIDLGSNTALMTVLVSHPRDLRRLAISEDLHIVTGLGYGRAPDGSLSRSGRDRALSALRHFASRLDALGLRSPAIQGVATAAVREAPNGADFIQEIAGETGVELQVISGDREAELVALAQERSFPRRLPLLVVDIGGGSTELALRRKGTSAWRLSLPIGSVKLAEQVGSDPVAASKVATELLAAVPRERIPCQLIGVAGTVTTALQVASGEELWDPEALHGEVLTLETVDRLVAELAALSAEARREVPGLHPGRADFIVPGLSLLASVMRWSDNTELLVSDRGVRFGLLWANWPLAAVL